MSDFTSILLKTIEPFHLSNHCFYKKWNQGKLNRRVLQEYSKQYFHHVDTFPRCISAIHSNCENLKNRQILLGVNLQNKCRNFLLNICRKYLIEI